MADFKISGLAAATALTDADLVELEQPGEAEGTRSRKATLAELRARFAAPRIVTTIASGTITPAGDTDLVRLAALTAALTIANPSSTPADGAGFVVDLIDNGTSRALTWGSKYANRMATLPTATTAGKRHRLGFEYNAADDKIYCMYAQVQA
jgi:hypothetical protein